MESPSSVEIDVLPDKALLMTGFARSVEDFGCGDGDLDAVVGIRSLSAGRRSLHVPSVNVPEEELREMVGASLVPATEAVKEARVLVAGEELESVTPRSRRFRCGGLSEVFLLRALRRASCASVRVPPPSLAKVSAFSSVTEAVTE